MNLNALKLIDITLRKLKLQQKLNLVSASLFPISLFVFAATLSHCFSLGWKAALIFTLFGLLTLGVFFRLISHLWAPIKRQKAAEIIDRYISGKERYLTLSTYSNNLSDAIDPLIVETITEQSDTLAEGFDLKKAVPLKVCYQSKLSLLLATVVFTISIVIWLHSPIRQLRNTSELQLAAAESKMLRELVSEQANLPPEIKNSVLNFAEVLADEKLSTEEVLSSLSETITEVNNYQSQTNSKSISASVQPKDPIVEEQRQETPINHEESTDSSPSEPTPESQGSEEKAEGHKDKEETVSPPGEKEGKQESLQPKEDGKEERPGQSEAQNKDKGSAEEKQREAEKDADKAKQGSEKEEKEQPDTATTGVGEGKGKGKSGDKEEQFGKAQSGSDSQQSKDGGAKNQSEQQEGDKNDHTREGQKGENSKGGQKHQENRKPGKGEGNKEKEGKKQLNGLKEQLEKIQQQLQGSKSDQESKDGQQSSPGQNEKSNQTQNKPEQSGSNKDGQKGKTPSSQEGSQEQNSENKGKNGSKKDSGARGSKTDSAETQDSDQPQQDNEKESSQTAQPKNRSGSKHDSSKQSNADPSSNEEEDLNSTPRPGESDHSKNAKKLPSDKSHPRRLSPFEGNEGGLQVGNNTTVDLQDITSTEEKIIVRSLGQTQGEVKHRETHVKAKTQIGSTEFAKPETQPEIGKQPIPVEYRDILR